jgi:hypothetical protein
VIVPRNVYCCRQRMRHLNPKCQSHFSSPTLWNAVRQGSYTAAEPPRTVSHTTKSPKYFFYSPPAHRIGTLILVSINLISFERHDGYVVVVRSQASCSDIPHHSLFSCQSCLFVCWMTSPSANIARSSCATAITGSRKP